MITSKKPRRHLARCLTSPVIDHPVYDVDETGSFRLKASGKRLSENDVSPDALAAAVQHVQETMKQNLAFTESFIPNADAPAKCNVFLSKNYNTCDNLLLFVTSSKGLQPGIWSRSLVLRHGLAAGSMLPYFQHALDQGYGIIVANPTSNSIITRDEQGQAMKIPIPCSSTQEEHLEYVWDTYVETAAAKRVYCIGYAYGGVLVKHLLTVRSQEFAKRAGAIAMIESSHRIDNKDSEELKSLFTERAIYWTSSRVPESTLLTGVAMERTGCVCISAGLPDHDGTSSNAAYTIEGIMDQVFRFLDVGNVKTFLQAEKIDTQSAESDPLTAPGAGLSATGSEKYCLLCNFSFTLFDRRHHCRMCHKAVCNKCSRDRLFLPGSSTAQRVCTICATDGATSLDISRNASSSKRKKDSMSVDDFDLLKVIGKGAFGKVMLVRKKTEKDSIFAMKVLKKVAVFAKNQVEHTKSERRILRDIDHPFVVRLRYAFQTQDKLYLVMDYYNGGSLFFHLRKARKFSESRAKFYAAQLVLAMAHLHQLHIAYRDLKLENILMDSRGYIALTDFGLSKENVDMPNGAKTFCGTAEYIAPELLRGLPYGKAVDWWGFGTLLYEMMTGQTPFFDRNRKRMFHNILHRDIAYPSSFSEDTKSLLSGLLRRDPAKRLGAGPGGVTEIMDHPFFESIDWTRLQSKALPPPFVPNVSSEADTTNIANVFTREIPRDSPVTQRIGERHRSQAHFEGFTYVPGSVLE